MMELRLMNDVYNGEHRASDTHCVHLFVEYMVVSIGIGNQVATEIKNSARRLIHLWTMGRIQDDNCVHTRRSIDIKCVSRFEGDRY